jgi:autotransporter family porin
VRKQIIFILIISVISILLVGSASAASSQKSDTTTSTIIYVSPNGDDANNGLTTSTAVKSIETGISKVKENGLVKLGAGTYNKTGAVGNDVNLNIAKNMTIAGAGRDVTFIDALNNSQIFNIQSGYTVLIKGITFQHGKLQNSGGAISNDGILTVANCTFKDNTADNEVGGALFTHTQLTVVNCIFMGNIANSGSAIFNKGGILTVSGSMFTYNQAVDDAIDFYSGGTINNYVGSLQLIGNSFINNIGSALHISSFVFAPEDQATAGLTGYEIIGSMNFNTIVGNTYGIYMVPLQNELSSGIPFRLNATNNWWGTNNNPKDNPTNIAGDIDMVLADPWLVLTIAANPNTVPFGSKAQVIADINHNNLGQDISSIGHIIDGTPITITTDIGNVGSKFITKYTVNGIVTAILRANDGLGTAHLNAFLYNFQTPVPAQVLITAVQPINPVNPPVKPVVKPVTKTDPNNIGTIAMQDTGIPLVGLFLALLMVLCGLTSQKSKLRL